MKKVMLVAIIMVLLVASACTKKEEAFDPNEKMTLKILHANEFVFFHDYGNLLADKFPNISFEILEDRLTHLELDEIHHLIEGNRPDILFLSETEYRQIAPEGTLYELDNLINRDNFDIENIHPAVVGWIKENGQGRLFGLSPTMESKALFYNKSMFELYGVPLPADQMTWSEVVELAMRFPSTGTDDERVYGFFENSWGEGILSLIAEIGWSQGLNSVDSAMKKVTMYTTSWKNAVETALPLLRSDAFITRPDEIVGDPNEVNYFANGRAAMTLASFAYINELENAKKRSSEMFEWAVVTAPVDPENRDYSSYYSMSQIISIPAQSANLQAAWEVVKYINSDEAAKLTANTSLFSLPARPESIHFLTLRYDVDMEPFIKLKPNFDAIQSDSDIPDEFYTSMFEIEMREMQAIIDGSQTIEEGLQMIDEWGQMELDRLLSETGME